MNNLTNFTIHPVIADMSGFQNDIEKSHVKSHTRTSQKTGKISQVNEYENKKTKSTPAKKGSSKYQIYHSSYSSACTEAHKLAEDQGYEVDQDSWFNNVSTGNKKPDDGKTNRHSIELSKDGKPSKKMLHFQVYGMGNGRYELNAYIN